MWIIFSRMRNWSTVFCLLSWKDGREAQLTYFAMKQSYSITYIVYRSFFTFSHSPWTLEVGPRGARIAYRQVQLSYWDRNYIIYLSFILYLWLRVSLFNVKIRSFSNFYTTLFRILLITFSFISFTRRYRWFSFRRRVVRMGNVGVQC